MRWGFDVSFVVASSPVGRPSAAQSSRSISEQGRTALLRLQQAVAGIPVHSSASSAAAVGNGRHHCAWDDRFGLALSTHPPHAHASHGHGHAKSHPTGVPCQSTLPIHPPGKFSPYTARPAPSQFSPVPLLCPPSLSTAPLRPRSVFPFLFLPLPPLAPRVLLCLFSLCARAACDFKKASFRVPFAVVLSPLLLVLACSLLRHTRQHPPRVSTLPILARQVPRRTRIRAVPAACCFRE